MTCGNNHPLVATSGRVIDVRPLPASPRFTMQTEQLHSGHSPDTSSAALDDDEAPHETQSSRSTATPDDATAALDAPTRSSAADIAHLQSTAVKERSTREAFRLYLKESGVVELFTSALVSLYNEAHQVRFGCTRHHHFRRSKTSFSRTAGRRNRVHSTARYRRRRERRLVRRLPRTHQ